MCIRILHVVTYMGRGGLETMLMNYYRHMDKSKVQFDFLVHREFEADYDEEIRELGGKIYRVSRLIPWSSSYKKQLKKFFMEHPEYRIVHVHQDCLSSVALQCAKECGVPVRIAHSHNNNQDKNWKYIVKRYYMKKIPDNATDLFACSKSAGDWMFQGKRYEVILNAIEAKKYVYSDLIAKKTRREFNLLDEYVIGHVGRFMLQKNHSFLIDIFYECVKINPNIKLLLVGDGEYKKNIQEKVEKLGISDKVIFAGVRSDVNRLLQAMDIFVFPSLYEGLGICVIEAQTAGLRCVISENVPDESIIIDNLVIKIPLECEKIQWAEEIMKNVGRKRENQLYEIERAGYDVITAVQKLEKFYLDKYMRN